MGVRTRTRRAVLGLVSAAFVLALCCSAAWASCAAPVITLSRAAAPVGEMSVNWWRMPAAQPPLASWMWFKQEDGTPFRLMFAQADETLAPLSWFASSHQVGFGPLQAGALAEVAALCRAAKPAASGNARERLRGMVSGLSRADARADGDIRRLMPELAEDCAGTSLPRWPDAFATTTFMTPLDVRHAPFPAQVLYDWRARAQRTRLSFPPSSPTRHEDALLVGDSLVDWETARNAGTGVCLARYGFGFREFPIGRLDGRERLIDAPGDLLRL